MKITLNSSDREFFRLVADAVFVNPFSMQRAKIDRLISQSRQDKPWRAIVPQVITEVAARIRTLDDQLLKQSGSLKPVHTGQAAVQIEDFTPADRQIIQYAFLFDVFHRHISQFDELIIRQANAGDEPIQVPFAQQAIKSLIARGFVPERAVRMFSLFYQIRRAFYFIDRGLIGHSPSMMALRMNLWNNIFTQDIRDYEKLLWNRMEDFSTLLTGATGSGKGAAAAAIGRSGFIPFDERKNTFAESFTRTFVSINLSQYPETLLESELFGHTKGSFTGAVASHNGVFSLCGRYGSIFLDEVGEISRQVQIKLLKVLEERQFSPVGSHEKLRFSGRVIAATNRPIDLLRQRGGFRDDFYYRLCSDCIAVPSLWQRIQEYPDEFEELVAHSVNLITGHQSQELTRAVLDVIRKRLGMEYRWPGNVRELAQCVRRVIIKGDYTGDRIAEEDTKDRIMGGIESGTLTAAELMAMYCRLLYKRFGTYEQVARRAGIDRRTAKKYTMPKTDGD